MPTDSFQHGLKIKQLKQGQKLRYSYGNASVEFSGSERQEATGISKDGNFYKFADLSHPEIITTDTTVENTKADANKGMSKDDLIAYGVEGMLRAQNLVKDHNPNAARDALTARLETRKGQVSQ